VLRGNDCVGVCTEMFRGRRLSMWCVGKERFPRGTIQVYHRKYSRAFLQAPINGLWEFRPSVETLNHFGIWEAAEKNCIMTNPKGNIVFGRTNRSFRTSISLFIFFPTILLQGKRKYIDPRFISPHWRRRFRVLTWDKSSLNLHVYIYIYIYIQKDIYIYPLKMKLRRNRVIPWQNYFWRKFNIYSYGFCTVRENICKIMCKIHGIIETRDLCNDSLLRNEHLMHDTFW